MKLLAITSFGASLAASLVAALLGPVGDAVKRRPSDDDVVTVLEGLKTDLLLGPDEVKRLGGRLSGAFGVSSAGRLVVGIDGKDGGNVVIPEIGVRLITEDTPGLVDFCRLESGLVMVRGEHLARYEAGRLIDVAALPTKRMRLAPSPRGGRFYVFGDREVYRVLAGRRYEKVIEAPEPVTAVVEMAGRLYVALGEKVISVSDRGALRLVYAPPAGAAPIRSLAGDAAARTLYIATADRVSALRGGVAVGLLAGCGGTLLHQSGSLYVLDAARAYVVRIPDVSTQLARGEQR